MHLKTLTILALLVVLAVPILADEPRIEVDAVGARVVGIGTGQRVAWMAMIREHADYRERVTILRGLEPLRPDGRLDLGSKEFDFSQSVWIVTELDGELTMKGAPAGYHSSSPGIEITATPGETSFAVSGASVHLTYVRRKEGAGTWSFAAADGSDLDADGRQNGIVVVALDRLRRFRGSPHPPDAVAVGDLVLVVDSARIRSAAVEVAP